MLSLEDKRAQALSLHKEGALDRAESLYRGILSDFRDDGQSWHYLAVLNGQRNRHEEVLKCCQEALRCGYSTASVHANAGLAHRSLGHYGRALRALQNSLAIDASDADLTLEYISLLRSSGNEQQALAQLRAACERFRSDPRFPTELGQVAAELNDGHLAEQAFRRATGLQPDSAEAWCNLGSILQMRGDRDGAGAAYRRAVTIDPQCNMAWWYLAQSLDAQKDEELAALIVARANSAGDSDSVALLFASAKIHYDAGRNDEAFATYSAANALLRRSFNYSVESDIVAMKRLATAVRSAPPEPAAPAQSNSAPTPVFIVGLPRSGSTLLEQMLARHAAIDAGGEIVWLQRHLCRALESAGLRYPDEQLLLKNERLAKLARRYHEALSARRKNGLFVTDKLPANFLCIPTIRRLFPDALIIHARRDALETCWSCFRQLFTGTQSFAYDLEELGQYATAAHEFVDVCRAQWPESVVELRYEALIDEPSAQIRAVLNRLGLAWDARCLSPEDSKSLVSTASAMQLRDGLSATPLGSAREYAGFLQPLLDGLRTASADRKPGPDTSPD